MRRSHFACVSKRRKPCAPRSCFLRVPFSHEGIALWEFDALVWSHVGLPRSTSRISKLAVGVQLKVGKTRVALTLSKFEGHSYWFVKEGTHFNRSFSIALMLCPFLTFRGRGGRKHCNARHFGLSFTCGFLCNVRLSSFHAWDALLLGCKVTSAT